MAKLNRAQIQKLALEALENAPGGMRWRQILRAVHLGNEETPSGSVSGGVRDLVLKSDEITQVGRGIYKKKKFESPADFVGEIEEKAEKETDIHGDKLSESDFYQSFAQWLKDMSEVNEAVVIGGNIFKGKWGTPDVVGILRPKKRDILKFDPQIIAAEIKIDPHQTIVAFGQAVSYHLFAHKSIIVVPNTISTDDLERLEVLCRIHRIGLVTFNISLNDPEYTRIVPAEYMDPDLFYTNEALHKMYEARQEEFEILFP